MENFSRSLSLSPALPICCQEEDDKEEDEQCIEKVDEREEKKSCRICLNNQLFMLNTLRFKPSLNKGDRWGRFGIEIERERKEKEEEKDV